MPSRPSRPWTLDALFAVRTRGDVRAAGEWLDGPGRPLRSDLIAAALRRGAELPEDAVGLPGKRLLRACLMRSEAAQVVTTLTARDDAFRCARCGADVPPGGRRPRDHCPWCLASLHVDDVPGDRAAGCGGLLVPVAVEVTSRGRDLVYRCERCGGARRNRVLDDVQPPDDPRVVLAVARAAAGGPTQMGGSGGAPVG